jgi:hypothetical protein
VPAIGRQCKLERRVASVAASILRVLLQAEAQQLARSCWHVGWQTRPVRLALDHACEYSGKINIVVAGGETQGAWKLISGSLLASVSIDAWR